MESFKPFTKTKPKDFHLPKGITFNQKAKPFCSEYLAPSDVRSPRNTFQAAMKVTVVIGQVFGLIPIVGVCEQNASKIRFTFQSTRCVYSILSIFAQAILAILCLLKIIRKSDSSLSANTAVVFFGTNCLTTVLFLQVARKWPKLCQTIRKFEDTDPIEDETLIKKCNYSFIIVMFLALVEHLLADLTTIASALNCQSDVNIVDAYMLQSFHWIWNYVPYNIFLGILAKIVCVQCTFTWNYSNVFVICVSWYLISRLENINHRLDNVTEMAMHAHIWQLIREDYSRASHLVRSVNEVVSGVVFISFAHNLFSVCMQMLHALEIETKTASTDPCNYKGRGPLNGYEHTVYFTFSSVFLIARSLAVCLIAAKVHSTSRVPANALYDVSATEYCVEVQRFLAQVHCDTVALTGYNFFNVTRGLVLVMGATIVTYELVFMQFAGVTTVVPTSVTLADLLTGS